jgi:hypothetical protein
MIPLDPTQEAARARALAQRYYHDFVDLREVRIDHELFHSIPVDLMFRYNFVPIQGQNGTLEIAMSDPRNPSLVDELGVLLNKKLRVKVATLSQNLGPAQENRAIPARARRSHGRLRARRGGRRRERRRDAVD